MNPAFQQIVSTPSVRAAQQKYNGKSALSATPVVTPAALSGEEIDFIVARDSFYIATVSETGWPFIQHRGGPRGFLRVLDRQTVGFADFAGNRQYITVGNISQNNRIALFLMDYNRRERLKMFGLARIFTASEAPDFAAKLAVPGYSARTERLFLIDVVAFDWNCSQHITPRDR